MSPTSAFATPAMPGMRTPFSGATLSCTRSAPTGLPAARRGVVRMAFSSIQGVLTADPVSLPSDIGSVIASVYNQVFGNAYLMESERAELATVESQFGINGNVREFVRAMALSDAYRSRFFEGVSQYRFIELAFKHLLGRAATSAAEYKEVMAVYHTKGYEACVSWFLDSEEYEENFGPYIVPYGIYKGCYPTNEEFNRSVAMRLTPSSSDKSRPSMLQYAVLSGDSPSWLSISKALPPGTERGTGFCIGGHWQSSQRNKNAPVRVGTKIPGGVVFYD